MASPLPLELWELLHQRQEMLRAPREPGLLIKGEWALLSIWGFIQDSWRAEAAPLCMAGWILELTSCAVQPGRSR